MAESTEESIILHSRLRATEDAVVVWALASAQYPLDHKVIQDQASVVLVEAVSNFSLNARRVLEAVPNRSQIQLDQHRWEWAPKANWEVVTTLWHALNRIIHAKRLIVGWELLPNGASVIPSGAIVIPYVLAETDRRPLAFVDPFSLAHAFLYRALLCLNRDSEVVTGGRPN